MKKKIFKDVYINLLSSFIFLFAIQILYYPEVSKQFSEHFFGEFIYIITIINLVGSLIGGTISNVFLKNYSTWKMNNTHFQKFSSLLYISIVIFLVFLLGCLIFNKQQLLGIAFSNQDVLYIFLITLFNQMRVILTTWLRAKLDYKVIFLLNIVVSGIYCLGWMLLRMNIPLNVFQILFFAEFSFFVVFLLVDKSHIRIFHIFNKIYEKKLYYSVVLLLFSSIFYTLYKYVDRVLIGHFMSLEFIPIFYVANITGLIFAVPFNVLSNVVFSYIAQKNTIEKNQLKLLLYIPFLLFISLFVISSFLGPVLIEHLYPEYYVEAMSIFKILNLGNALLVLDYLIRGFIIKYYSEGYKVISDFIALSFFIGVSVVFFESSLVSFAYGYTVGIIVKCLYNYSLLIVYFRKVIKS